MTAAPRKPVARRAPTKAVEQTTPSNDPEPQAEEVATTEQLPIAEEPASEPLTPAVSPPGERGRIFDVTGLHAVLASSAQRCYPAAARRYHLTGEARIDFCLDSTGALTKTTLAASSGQLLLDTAASECVIAGALPMPREAAGGCYTVPVRFGGN